MTETFTSDHTLADGRPLRIAVTVGDPPAKPPEPARLAVGLTAAPAELAAHLAAHPGMAACRVFSPDVPPPWSDPRIQQLKAAGVIPFVSFKTFNVGRFDSWLRSKPANIPMVYVAHYHEPENDLTPDVYKAHQMAMWSVVQALPAALRTQFKYGPIQAKQWTENTAAHAYATYDPGVGDFWGVDSYVNTWSLAYPDPAAWLAQVLAYDTGGRERWIPELGVISMPSDVDDTRRAQWIDGVARVLEQSDVRLALWWCAPGTAGAAVPGVDTARNFHLDQKYTTAGGAVTLNPAPSATAWRTFMARNQTGGVV